MLCKGGQLPLKLKPGQSGILQPSSFVVVDGRTVKVDPYPSCRKAVVGRAQMIAFNKQLQHSSEDVANSMGSLVCAKTYSQYPVVFSVAKVRPREEAGLGQCSGRAHARRCAATMRARTWPAPSRRSTLIESTFSGIPL